jgi:hypothetical protein
VLVGGADARLGQAAGDGARLLASTDVVARLVMPLASAPTMPGSSTVPGRPCWKVAVLARPSKPAGQAAGRQKDRRLDEGQADLGLGDGGLRRSRLASRLALRLARISGLS